MQAKAPYEFEEILVKYFETALTVGLLTYALAALLTFSSLALSSRLSGQISAWANPYSPS
jgi:hypothetical protein